MQGDLFSNEAQAVAGLADVDKTDADGKPKAKAKREFVLSPTWKEDINKLITNAIAAGTHSTRNQRVCHKCREWCDGIFHQTLDGMEMCIKCAASIGVKEAVAHLRKLDQASGILATQEPAYVAPSAFNPFEDLPESAKMPEEELPF